MEWDNFYKNKVGVLYVFSTNKCAFKHGGQC